MGEQVPEPIDPALVATLKALANDKRLLILFWLRDPRAHFPEQRDGDLVNDGVCAVFLAEKLGITQPTLHQHMKQLVDADLVRGRKIKQWTFYKRREARLAELSHAIGKTI
ncbi:MAG: ArsR/SmtB family transcription factor [Hyphomicrobiaceae bacterium]